MAGSNVQKNDWLVEQNSQTRSQKNWKNKTNGNVKRRTLALGAKRGFDTGWLGFGGASLISWDKIINMKISKP